MVRWTPDFGRPDKVKPLDWKAPYQEDDDAGQATCVWGSVQGQGGNPVRHGSCRVNKWASWEGRGCPYPLAGRSLRPPRPSLTRRRLYSDIHVSAGRLRRSRIRATPPGDCVKKTRPAQQRTPQVDETVAAPARTTSPRVLALVASIRTGLPLNTSKCVCSR